LFLKTQPILLNSDPETPKKIKERDTSSNNKEKYSYTVACMAFYRGCSEKMFRCYWYLFILEWNEYI